MAEGEPQLKMVFSADGTRSAMVPVSFTPADIARVLGAPKEAQPSPDAFDESDTFGPPLLRDTSQDFVGPPAMTPKDILQETVLDPVAKFGSMFVPEDGAPRPEMSPAEQRLGQSADVKARMGAAQTQEERTALQRELIDVERGELEYAPADLPIGKGGFRESTMVRAADALTPDFVKNVVYDAGDILAGDAPESAAQMKSPFLRTMTEMAVNISRDVDEEEQRARDWARGDTPQPGAGIASNLVVGNPLIPKQQRSKLGISVPPPEESYLKEVELTAGAAAGAVKSLAQGAFDEATEEVGRFQERMKINYARMVRQEALEAKKQGKRAVRLPFTAHAVDVDTLLDKYNQEQASMDYARLQELQSSIGAAKDEMYERLNKKLEGSPGVVSWHTVRNWREAVGEMVSGVGGLLLHAGGMVNRPKQLSLDERGRYKVPVEDFWDAFLAGDAVNQLMGGRLTADAVAGFATNVNIGDPATVLKALEVDGPLVLMDVLPMFGYAKAMAAAGKIRLPASAIRKIDYLIELAEPMVDHLSRVSDPVKRMLGDAGSNRERLATEAYDTVTRQTREEQAAIDSALKQVARMVDEGYELGLREAEEPVRVVEGPEGQRIDILPEEEKMFNTKVDQRVREQVEEAGGLVVPDIIPDEVRKRANARVFDENAITDSVRGDEILLEELEKYESEFGKATRQVEMPGTKKKKGGTAETAQLDEQQSALWDKINAKYKALEERLKKKAGAVDRRFKNEQRRLTERQKIGKEIGKLKAQRSGELRAVVERMHEDLSTKFEARRDRLKRLESDAQWSAAQDVVSRRSAFGTTRSTLDARGMPVRVPIGTNVWTATADVVPEEGRVFLRTPSTPEVEKFGRQLDEADLTPEQRTAMMDAYRGHGAYRGEQYRSEGKPRVTPRIKAAPEILEIINNIVDVAGRNQDDKFRLLNEIEANIARSIDQGLPEFLRSKTAQNRMAQELVGVIQKRITKRGPLDKDTRNALVTGVSRVLEEIGSGKTPDAGQPGSALPLNIEFVVKHKNGQESRINMLDEVASIVFKDKEKARTIVLESLVQTARRQSIRRSQQLIQDAYTDMADPVYLYAESVSKLTGKPIKAPTPKSEAYRGVATQLSERSLPTMFAENPTAIRGEVDGILENADRFKELKKFLSKDKDAGGIGREVTDAEVTRYLKRLRRRVSTYVDAGSGKDYKYMRGLLRIGDDLFDADRVIDRATSQAFGQKQRQRRTVDIKAKPLMGLDDAGNKRAGALYMQKNLAKALDSYGKATEAAKNADMMMRSTTFLKTNLTARQLTTLKNNVVSNVILQSVRRGDPLVLPKLIRDFVKYKQWERGSKGLSEADSEMFQALTDSGKINTSFVDAEIAALGQSGVLGKLVDQGHIRSGMKSFVDKLFAPQKVIEDVYKFSDEMFKIEEGVRSYKQINRYLSKLEEGQHITLRVSPVRKVRITLYRRGETFKRSIFEVDGKVVQPDKFNAIIGKAAMQVGEDLFFNYFDVGDLARNIRTSSAFALASPFYTWFSKALDIPFVKRGLLSEIYRGSPYIDTNNASIIAELAANQTRIGGTMDIAAAYGQQGPYDQEAMKMLRKTLGWGRGTQQGVFNTDAYAGLVGGYVNLNQANPFGATDLIFRSIEGGPQAIIDAVGLGDDAQDVVNAYSTKGRLDWGLEGASKEQKAATLKLRKFMMSKAAGEAGISLADSLDLVGLAGHPILEIWHLAAEAEKRDKPVSLQGMGRRLANMLVGGTYARAFDAIIGGQAPTSAMTSRYRFADPIAGEEESFIRGAIRKVTGIGWQPVNVRKRGEKYFDRLEQRWDDTLVAPITTDMRLLERRFRDTTIGEDAILDAREQYRNAGRLKSQMRAIIKREINSMRKQHNKLVLLMKETKNAPEEPLPPGTKGRTGTLNVIRGAR